ncbi:MAG: N-glycosylase/DNA lyase [Candidatus Thermoplasmatota archaeon]|nr:N-glycosylase/DNA lyase [Candidatus Thermoplasmatota archaeon]
MNELINKIEELKISNIGKTIDERIAEFKNFNTESNDDLFKEACFCILTANFNAEKSIKIQNEIGNCFITDSEESISRKLKDSGHRFPNARASYISEFKECKEQLNKVINHHDMSAVRDWLVKNVKGLGYKEASHFLRNIGFEDYAIIDFHIVDILVKYKLIEKPKSMTKNKYFEIENLLRKIAKKTGLTLAELDLYLWYMETGKVLK